MREATIGGAAPLDQVRPRKTTGGRSPSSGGPRAKRKGGFWPAFRRFQSRFALIVGSAGFSAIMIGIVVNATMMQKDHHPAPLFGSTAAPVAAAAPAVPAGRPVVTAAAPAAVQSLPAAPAVVPAQTLPVIPSVPAKAAAASAPARVATAARKPVRAAAALQHPASNHQAAARPSGSGHVDGIGQLLSSLSHGAKPAGSSTHARTAEQPARTGAVAARKDHGAAADLVD